MGWLSLGIFCVISLYAIAIEPGCQNCGCCKYNICEVKFVREQEIYVKEYCTHGCIPGIGGNKCYNKCPDSCLTCEQTYPKICESCAAGKYLRATKGGCLDCPTTCKTCTSPTQCQVCVHPYFNDDKKQDCSLSCPRNCQCESIGICSACEQGYYNASNQCQNVCPSTCVECTNQGLCPSCKPSYSGDRCCLKDGHCLRCSSSSYCEVCVNGYYGEQCNKRCPGTCKVIGKQSQCERTSGVCLSCSDGYHGDYCTRNCNKRCLNQRCHKDFGYCTDGCIDGFEGSTCSDQIITEATTVFTGTTTDNTNEIAIALTAVIVIVTVVVIVAIIVVRRWKKNQQEVKDNEHCVSYDNTGAVNPDACVDDVQIEQNQYVKLH